MRVTPLKLGAKERITLDAADNRSGSEGSCAPMVAPCAKCPTDASPYAQRKTEKALLSDCVSRRGDDGPEVTGEREGTLDCDERRETSMSVS